MEQVLFRLHVRFSRAFCYVFNPTSRRYLEAMSLMNACLCLSILVILHTTFLRPINENNCIYQALYDQGNDSIDMNFDVLEIAFVSNTQPNHLCLFSDRTDEINDGENDSNLWNWIKQHVCISKTPDRNMAKEFWFSLDKGALISILVYLVCRNFIIFIPAS